MKPLPAVGKLEQAHGSRILFYDAYLDYRMGGLSQAAQLIPACGFGTLPRLRNLCGITLVVALPQRAFGEFRYLCMVVSVLGVDASFLGIQMLRLHANLFPENSLLALRH